jgi:TolA-binding protein
MSEQEADAEVERQRKERERKQKQDVMTLGETRDQISQLEVRLAQLKDEKHQLFLQLKKVLNEDDNRRRQLVKESKYVSFNVLVLRNMCIGSGDKIEWHGIKFLHKSFASKWCPV